MSRADSLRDSAVFHFLKNTSLFSGLADEHLIRITTYSKIISLDKNTYLFRENEPVQGFYVVYQGIINVHRVSSDGREQVLHIFRKGETLAEAALVSSTGYPADARAEVNSKAILIPSQDFMRHQQQHPDLAWRMFASMSQHLKTLVALVENLKLKDTETRFLHWLLHRCPQPLTESLIEIELGMAKSVLAAELSTRQETLSRIFAKLRDAGLIEVKNNAIVVTNPQNLQLYFDKILTVATEK